VRVSIDHPTNRPNYSIVYVGDITLWFSYRTCIAFQVDGEPARVSENLWGPTTGRHINLAPAVQRSPRAVFEHLLAVALDGVTVRA
jgi:hypothetical protein